MLGELADDDVSEEVVRQVLRFVILEVQGGHPAAGADVLRILEELDQARDGVLAVDALPAGTERGDRRRVSPSREA